MDYTPADPRRRNADLIICLRSKIAHTRATSKGRSHSNPTGERTRNCDGFEELKEQLAKYRDPQYAGIIQNMIDRHIAGCDTCKKNKSQVS